MTRLEKIEREIAALPPKDIRALAGWLDALREQLWDEEIAAGSPALDRLAADALSDFAEGKTTPLTRGK